MDKNVSSLRTFGGNDTAPAAVDNDHFPSSRAGRRGRGLAFLNPLILWLPEKFLPLPHLAGEARDEMTVEWKEQRPPAQSRAFTKKTLMRIREGRNVKSQFREGGVEARRYNLKTEGGSLVV